LAVGSFGYFDYFFFNQVALLGWRLADIDGLVGQLYMKRVDVRVREHRDALDAETIGGSDYATRDLASIGNQYPTNSHSQSESIQDL
jgi:hypothetical protein